MDAPLRLLLVRHGESESNAGEVSEDAASAALTALGVRQARAFADRLDVPPARFVVSPYRRARETAAAAIARFPGVPVETWPVQEFTFLSPAQYRGTTVATRKPAAEAYWTAADPHAVTGEGAESFAAFLARVRETRTRLESAASGPVVVFSHKKFLNALLWTWLAGDPSPSSSRMRRYREFDHAMPFVNAGCVEVRVGAGGAWVGAISVAHLEGLPA